jgi:DNA-binding MarR family transcriptional regulator
MENEPYDQRTSTWGYREAGDPLISALVHELRNRQSAADLLEQEAAAALGVHRTAARCLELLSRQGAMGAGELAAGIGLTPSGTTALLDRLEKAGAIERLRASGKDRRTITIELTPKGRAVVREVWDDLYEPLGQLTVDFRRTELELVLGFLRQANAILSARTALRGDSGAGTADDARSEPRELPPPLPEWLSRPAPSSGRAVSVEPPPASVELPPSYLAPIRHPIETPSQLDEAPTRHVATPPPAEEHAEEPAAAPAKRRRFSRRPPPPEPPEEREGPARWRPTGG